MKGSNTISIKHWLGMSLLWGLLLLSQIALAQEEGNSLSVSGATTTCVNQQNNTYSLEGYPGTAFSWAITPGTGYFYNGVNTGRSVIIVWTSPGNRNVNVTHDQGLVAAGNLGVSVSSGPAVTISSSSVLVPEDTPVTLTATGGTSYSWTYQPAYNGFTYPISGTSSSVTVSEIADNTTFNVTGYQGECQNSASVLVKLLKKPTLANFGPVTFNSSISLNATPGANGLTCNWYKQDGTLQQSGQTTTTLNLSVGANHFYVTSVNGGVESKPFHFTVTRLVASAAISYTGPNYSCGGDVVKVKDFVQGATTYQQFEGDPVSPISLSYQWYENDGVTATGQNPTAEENNLGIISTGKTVKVKVTATGAFGSVASGLASVPISPSSRPNPPTVTVTNCGGTIQMSGAGAGQTYLLEVIQREIDTWLSPIEFLDSDGDGIIQLGSEYHLKKTANNETKYKIYIVDGSGCKSNPANIFSEFDFTNHALTASTQEATCGTVATFTAKLLGSALPNGYYASYHWTIRREIAPGNHIDETFTTSSSTLSYTLKPGTTTAYVKVKDQNGCESQGTLILSTPITVTPPSNPLQSADLNVTGCGTAVTVNNPQAGITYHLTIEQHNGSEWTEQNTLSSTTGSFTGLPGLSNTQRYQLHLETTATTCVTTAFTLTRSTWVATLQQVADVCLDQDATVTFPSPPSNLASFTWYKQKQGSPTIESLTGQLGQYNYSFKADEVYDIWVEAVDTWGCTHSYQKLTVNPKSKGIAPTVIADQAVFCGSGKTLIRVVGGASGMVYRWYTTDPASDPNASYTTSTVPYLITSELTATTTFYVKMECSNGCLSDAGFTEVKVHPLLPRPTVVAIPAIDKPGDRTVTVSGADGTNQTYVWYASAEATEPIAGQNGASYTANYTKTTVVYVAIKNTATSCIGEKLPLPVRVLNDYSQVLATDLNITGVQTVRVKKTNKADLDGLTMAQRETLWQKAYLDGLGRPIQTVTEESSPTGLDVVQTVVYDELSRTPKTYLPYTTGTNLKGFKPMAFTMTNGQIEVETFYGGSDKPHATSSKPFAQVDLEASPLNRAWVQYAPGESWVGAGKGVSTHPSFNCDPTDANTPVDDKIHLLRVVNSLQSQAVDVPKEEVILNALQKTVGGQKVTYYKASQRFVLQAGFTIAEDDPTITFEITDSDNNKPFVAGFYAAGELSKVTVTDEDGKITEEFKNKKDQVILKRSKIDEGTDIWAQTYYVYDDFGQLSYVLPPEAVKVLDANADPQTHAWVLSEEVCAEASRFWYRYYYDNQRRLISKEVPGAGKVMMVYDKRDRLVLSQDANQRQRDEWSFTKYDQLNRPVITGIYTSTQTREQLQTALDANFGTTGYLASESFDATQNGAGQHLYTNQSFPTTGLNVHSVSYYDNYAWKTAHPGYDYEAMKGVVIASDDPNPEPVSYVNTGQITATKTKILDNDGDNSNDDYLLTVSYYDCRGRVIQTVADNHLKAVGGQKGQDRTMTAYAFDGLVKQTLVKHYSAANDNTHYVGQWTEYDNTGRVLKTYQEVSKGTSPVYKSLDNAKQDAKVEKISELAYNEIGQLITKKLGTKNKVAPLTTPNGLDDLAVLQTLDFKYNIRGWMTHLNDAGLSTAGTEPGKDNDLFGFELNYDQKRDATAGFLNGNITQMTWRSSLDKVERQYTYTYDNLNRLKTATYSSATNAAEDGRYSVNNISYDLNGNIKTLTRQGLLTKDVQLNMTFGKMDDLTYQYKGNQLTQVEDNEASASGVAGDFRNGHVATTDNPDYYYDVSGNMIQDKNKEITSIIYNHLNLPTVIQFSNNRRIEYTYDAAGIKLKKQVFDNSSTPTSWTNYVGSFVYEGDNLQFIHTAEGRALAPGTVEDNLAFLYEYHYKDHLGNLRVAFREGGTDTYKATMETGDPGEGEFDAIAETRDGTRARTGTQSARVGKDSQRLGPWKTLAVSKGDSVEIGTYVFYDGVSPNNSSAPSLFEFIGTLNANTNEEGERTVNNPFYFQLGVGVNAAALTNPNPGTNLPAAYLKYIFYSKEGENIKEGVVFVDQTANGTWRPLNLDFTAKENGYLQVFVANESEETNAWFDDLEIKHYKNLIVQENHYYPFGMNLAGIEKQGKPDHKFQYNGKEKQEEFGLNWYDYEARTTDIQLGRFSQIDPHAKNYFSISPYVYVNNMPTIAVDPDGKDIVISFINNQGNRDSYTYKIGQKYKGDNKFVAETVQALDFIIKQDRSASKYAKDLATDSKAKFTISYTKGGSWFRPANFAGEGKLTMTNTIAHTGTVYFNPESGIITKSGKKIAPVVVLFHELDHAGIYNKDRQKYLNLFDNKSDKHKDMLEKQATDAETAFSKDYSRPANLMVSSPDINLGGTRKNYNDVDHDATAKYKFSSMFNIRIAKSTKYPLRDATRIRKKRK